MTQKVRLPIDEHIPEILRRFRESQNMILAATPGSGKTTRLPSQLLSLTNKKILVLEPRRIATVSAVDRIASEENWQVGREIGYQVRFENKVSNDTRLIFFTEALLLRWLQRDPELADVGLIVLDEFHERSVHTDTALALLRELQESFRPDLKILIMSATLQVEVLKTYLPDAATFEVEAPIFPLEIQKTDKMPMYRPGLGFKQQELFFEAVADAALRGVSQSPGQKDVLVFLPGVREINEVRERLENKISERKIAFLKVMALHAQLPLEEQKRVLRPLNSERKIILATNVAESALTIEGIDTVVDSGLERISMIHRRTGHPSLELVRISKASATQRAGRAARLGPGLGIQLWNRHDDAAMAAERPAEIHRVDLSETHLFLAGQSILNPESLPWLESPGVEAWRRSTALLSKLELIDTDGRLTEIGKKLLQYPLAPRWALLLTSSLDKGQAYLGAEIAALLQNWPQDKRRIANFQTYFDEWRRNPQDPRFNATRRSLEQLLRLAKVQGKAAAKDISPAQLAEILWSSYADRLSRIRPGQEQMAQMREGRGIKRADPIAPSASGFFLALELIEGLSDSESLCSLYFDLPEAFVKKTLLPHGQPERRIDWIDKESAFVVWEGLKLDEIWLDQPRRSRPRPEEVEEGLAALAVKNWKEIVSRNERLAILMARLEFWNKHARIPGPEMSEELLAKILPFMSMGRTSLQAFYDEDLDDLFLQGLSQASDMNVSEFQRALPAAMTSPRGRRLVIDYREQPAPKVMIRIQDAFGWKDTPQLLGVPLLVELLAPNNRPAQRTQDLAGFWKNSYKDVRKDLRARYPRHAWPEDPMEIPKDED